MGKVNETQMALAINAINNDGMDLRSAARAYGVKKSTLNDRIHGTGNKSGPRTKLSDFTERLLLTTFQTCSDIGMSLNMNQILDLVEGYLKQTKQHKLFKNGRPSTKWYYGFIERHKKELSVKYFILLKYGHYFIFT